MLLRSHILRVSTVEFSNLRAKIQSVWFFFGDQFARVSSPSVSTDGIFRGRLAIWTEIDPSEPVIFKASLEQSLIEDTELSVPEGVGFNSKVFYFSFRESDHTLFVELENDSNNTISTSRVQKAFSKIFDGLEVGGVDDIAVHQKSQRNAVDRVLAIPRLRRIEIVVNIPNPDDMQEDMQQVWDEINSMNAKKLATEIVKAPGKDTLILNHKYRVMAQVAKDNGYVSGEGHTADGEKVERSTKEYPEVVEVTLEEGETEYRKVRQVALEYPGE
jgi:hypothetical protein